MKTYDGVAYRNKWSKELQDRLRKMTEAELKHATERFGQARYFIHFFKSGSPSGGYPEPLVRFHEIFSYKVAVRAYWGAPEFLPEDFDWEPIKERGEVTIGEGEEAKQRPAAYGGTLKNAAKRA